MLAETAARSGFMPAMRLEACGISNDHNQQQRERRGCGFAHAMNKKEIGFILVTGSDRERRRRCATKAVESELSRTKGDDACADQAPRFKNVGDPGRDYDPVQRGLIRAREVGCERAFARQHRLSGFFGGCSGMNRKRLNKGRVGLHTGLRHESKRRRQE